MRSTTPLFVMVALSGCGKDKGAPIGTQSTSDSGGGGESGGEDSEEAPYLADADTLEVPDTPSSEIASTIELAIEEAFNIDTTPVFAAYAQAMEGAEHDGDCPLWLTGESGPVWYSTCTSTDGTVFDGYGSLITYEDHVNADGSVYNGMQLYSFSKITTPDGNTFKAGGGIARITITATTGDVYEYQQINGQFSWDGEEAEGTWLTTDIEPSMSMVASVLSTGDTWVELNGALAGLPDDQAVVFQGMSASPYFAQGDCAPEPHGNVSVLDSETNWFDLEFSGATWSVEADPTTGCDGCAQAWYRGIEIDPVCPSFDALWNWSGDAPWK